MRPIFGKLVATLGFLSSRIEISPWQTSQDSTVSGCDLVLITIRHLIRDAPKPAVKQVNTLDPLLAGLHLLLSEAISIGEEESLEFRALQSSPQRTPTPSIKYLGKLAIN
jgi:hypothetical protein